MTTQTTIPTAAKTSNEERSCHCQHHILSVHVHDRRFACRVLAVFFDAVRDIIWAQTIEKNLFRISSGNKAIRKAEINFHDKITAMIFQNDYCYVGTLKGLYRWDIDSNTTEALLKDISINSLFRGTTYSLGGNRHARCRFIVGAAK